MRERPILFSAPMVRAILEGRKTQTRRVIKFPSTGAFVCVQGYWTSQTADQWWPLVSCDGESILDQNGNETPMRPPYGKPGDRLWVKEGFSYSTGIDDLPLQTVIYRADKSSSDWASERRNRQTEPNRSPWKSSLFMPRWASRITLEITDVRVERLQDISEEDAIAEGCKAWKGVPGDGEMSAVQAYSTLWDSINGEGAWDTNPWVWAVSFRRVEVR